MSFHIIIKGKNHYGKSRAEQEANLRKDGYVGMSDEHFDKAKWVEKRIGYKGFVPQPILSDTDMVDGTSSKNKE